MKATELRPCDVCGRVLNHEGNITFHRVRFERFGIDVASVRERVALSLLWNNRAPAAVVEAFASREDVAVLIHEPADLFLCEPCAHGMPTNHPVGVLSEMAHEKLEERKLAAQPKTMQGGT